MKDVAIILPSIRPQNLIKFYGSVLKACRNYTFEIVIPSPYLPPLELLKMGNVKFLHTYANPTISFQLGALLSNSRYIYNTTDDGLVQERAIDTALEILKNETPYTIINMIYKEGILDPETLEYLPNNKSYHPPEYWMAWYHGDLRKPAIKQNWKMCMHFFINSAYFFELGGFDCKFEYSNHAIHDLMFRAQEFGSKIKELPIDAFHCSHLPEKTGDHGPVHDAQTGPDTVYFNEIYSKPEILSKRIFLNYNNWKDHSDIWERRFDKNNLKLSP